MFIEMRLRPRLRWLYPELRIVLHLFYISVRQEVRDFGCLLNFLDVGLVMLPPTPLRLIPSSLHDVPVEGREPRGSLWVILGSLDRHELRYPLLGLHFLPILFAAAAVLLSE